MDRLRLTRPGDGADEGFASGGWMAPPAPNGGRSGLKLGCRLFRFARSPCADASTGSRRGGRDDRDGRRNGQGAQPQQALVPRDAESAAHRGVTGATCAFDFRSAHLPRRPDVPYVSASASVLLQYSSAGRFFQRD